MSFAMVAIIIAGLVLSRTSYRRPLQRVGGPVRTSWDVVYIGWERRALLAG